MIGITIKYKGDSYPISGASGIISQIAERAFIERIEAKLKPFVSEVEQSGGALIVEVLEGLKVNVIARDLPAELIQRIQESARQA